MTELAVGMELWWVPSNRYGAAAAVTVEKVGRKWATLSNRHRIDIETLIGDGGDYSPPGKAWPSKDVYEAHRAIVVAWNDLRSDITKTWQPPAGVGVPAINSARQILGLEVKTEEAETP